MIDEVKLLPMACGAEALRLTNKLKQNLSVAQRNMGRPMLNITKKDEWRNNNIRKEMKVQDV